MKRSSIESLVPQLKAFSDKLFDNHIEEFYYSIDIDSPKKYEVIVIEEDGKLYSALHVTVEYNGITIHDTTITVNYEPVYKPTIAQLVKIQQVLKEYFTPDGYVEPLKP